MLYAVGTKVRLKHTGDAGVIYKHLGRRNAECFHRKPRHGNPSFEEDLERAEDYDNTHVKAKIVATPLPKKIVKYDQQKIETQYTILKSGGLQLAF